MVIILETLTEKLRIKTGTQTDEGFLFKDPVSTNQSTGFPFSRSVLLNYVAVRHYKLLLFSMTQLVSVTVNLDTGRVETPVYKPRIPLSSTIDVTKVWEHCHPCTSSPSTRRSRLGSVIHRDPVRSRPRWGHPNPVKHT